MNITADENIPYVKEAFQKLGNVNVTNGRDLKKTDLKQTDILLVRSVTKVNQSLLHNTPIKFVASATAGFNHIDLEYLTSQNIGFARAPGSNAISAAEYVLTGICLWSLKENKSLPELSIGIIGCGNVGSRVKKLCESTGITCLINDPPLEQKQETDYQFSSLNKVLACDIVTLHTPLSYEGDHPTFQLLNEQRINQLKSKSLFINASRGEVVQEAALLTRMNKGNDLTLILDVWENEPKINIQMLEHTLIGTPHIAGYSIDGKVRGTEMIYHAVCEYLDVKPEWSVGQVDFGSKPKPCIELSINENNQTEILEAYNIVSDNDNLKKIIKEQPLQDGIYFDSLRRNYPSRREFSTLK